MGPATDKDGVTLRIAKESPRVTEALLPTAHSSDLSGQKRKAPETKKNRFKAVAQLVMAMKRFQGV